MTIATAKRFWTDEELLGMPKDGYDREIIDGELVMSPAGSEHGAIIMAIAGPLHMHVRANNLGEVLDGQTGCRMSNGDLLSPDVSFVSTERWNACRKVKAVFIPGGPDLVVEVLSPDDSMKAIKRKLEEYFADGTRLAWVVDPRKKCVTVYRSMAESHVLQVDGVLTGADVAPGFSLAIASIFRD